jgi:hypothetical protein
MVPMLMRLLADAVFESALSMRRSFEQEMTRYLEERGFRAESAPKPPIA